MRRDETEGPRKGASAGSDGVPYAALRHLDPGHDDPGYWLRFHRTVMAAARGELERRRRLPDLTVSELLTSWGRMVVPTAMAAAAVALLLLFGSGGPIPADGDAPVALEEALSDGLGTLAPSGWEPVEAVFASDNF